MIYNLSKNDIKLLEKLFERNDLNIMSANMYLDFIENYPHVFSSDDENYTRDFINLMEIDEEDFQNKKFINDYIFNSISKLDFEKYIHNEYLANVKPQEYKKGNIELKYQSYKKYETFISDDIYVNEGFVENSKLGYFDKEFKFLTLLENDQIWMLISPNEINTMQKHVNEANGNVLVLGLGLGYFPYMISLKNNIKSITIIENNKDIIDMFNLHISQYFNKKIPLNIKYCDAIDELKNANKYDFIFCDLWHNPNDALSLYFKIKNFENQKTRFSYWLENGILALIRRCLITLIEEETNHSSDEDYIKSDNITDTLINKMHFYLKNKKINNYEDIKKLLSDDSLKSLARNIEL